MKCAVCDHDLVEDAVFCPWCSTRVKGAEERDDYAYEAFISYRHLPLDHKVAVKVQRAIEGFAIPKALHEQTGKRRLGKCFRDTDELPTSSSLSDQITEALKRSRYLVVVCSTNTRESVWVQREVELFCSYHGRDRVVVALAEGEPEESFPELLLTQARCADDGSVTYVPVEPLAADMRDLSRKQFSVERLRIIARIVGCSFDDLRQRMRARTMRVYAAAAAVVTAVSTAFAGMATYQEARIREEYRQIQIKESEFLANEANELLASGDRYQAVQVALAALPSSEEAPDRPFVPAAQMALENALGLFPQQSDWHSCYSQTDLAVRGASSGVTFGPDGLEAIVALDRQVEVRKTASGDLVVRIDAERQLGVSFEPDRVYCSLAFAGDKLVCAYTGAVGCFDAQTGELLWSMDLPDVAYDDKAIAVSPDGTTVAVFEKPLSGKEEFVVKLVDATKGTVKSTVTLPGYDALGGMVYQTRGVVSAFVTDGAHLYVCWNQRLFRIDVATGAFEQKPINCPEVMSLYCIDDLLTVASRDVSTSYFTPTISLEVYDASFEKLWERRETVDVPADSSGTEYWYTLGVRGVWNYHGGDDRQLVVLWGPRLLLLDKQTGKEEFALSCVSTFLDAGVLDVEGAKRIVASTADGTLMCRMPREANNGRGGAVSDVNLGVGSLQRGAFVSIDGRAYCSAWTESPNKRMVHTLWSAQDMPEAREFVKGVSYKNVYATTWSQNAMVVMTSDELLFLDGKTLEVTATTPLSRLEYLDNDAKTLWQSVLSRTGNYYLAGPARRAGEDRSSGFVIYRVGVADGVPKLVMGQYGTGTLGTLDTVIQDDGTEQLLVSGRWEEETQIDLLNVDGTPVWQIPVNGASSDVKRVWYADGRIIVYGNVGEGRSTGFALIDVAQGAEVESDLARYALRFDYQRDSCAAISYDCTTFAVACSDGLIRLFDAHTGSLLWETDQAPTNVNLLRMTSEGNVFVQDEFGRCVLVSGKTGDVVAASAATLSPFKGATHHVEDNTMVAYFSEPGLLGRGGIVIMSLDEDLFGPLSVLYNCTLVSTDNRVVGIENGWNDELLVAKRPGLDELLHIANQLVQDHQLTDAERTIYQTNGERI